MSTRLKVWFVPPAQSSKMNEIMLTVNVPAISNLRGVHVYQTWHITVTLCAYWPPAGGRGGGGGITTAKLSHTAGYFKDT